MSVYPVAEPYPTCDEVPVTTDALYLGNLQADPVTTVEGTFYWNDASNLFRIWSDNAWFSVTPEAFDGIVDGGTVTRTDTIKVRGDTAANWIISNTILLDREIGLETDTNYFKFGDGTSTWNDLEYPTIPSTRVIGIENVDNISDIDKPVSTLQAEADALVLSTANEYTDDAVIGLFKDMGSYTPESNSTGFFPNDVVILQGHTYICSANAAYNSYKLFSGEQVRALVDDPGQIYSNWIITPRKSNLAIPYIISLFIPGTPVANQILMYHDLPVAITIPGDLSNSVAKCKTKPYSDVDFIIKKDGNTIGLISFTVNSFIGTLTFTNPVLKTCSVGSVLEICNAAIPDALIADITISILGERN